VDWSIWSVLLVSLLEPEKPNKPKQPEKPDRPDEPNEPDEQERRARRAKRGRLDSLPLHMSHQSHTSFSGVAWLILEGARSASRRTTRLPIPASRRFPNVLRPCILSKCFTQTYWAITLALPDDWMSFGEYVEPVTCLLFLKMGDERDSMVKSMVL
jgi:hypothetical protein